MDNWSRAIIHCSYSYFTLKQQTIKLVRAVSVIFTNPVSKTFPSSWHNYELCLDEEIEDIRKQLTTEDEKKQFELELSKHNNNLWNFPETPYQYYNHFNPYSTFSTIHAKILHMLESYNPKYIFAANTESCNLCENFLNDYDIYHKGNGSNPKPQNLKYVPICIDQKNPELHMDETEDPEIVLQDLVQRYEDRF